MAKSLLASLVICLLILTTTPISKAASIEELKQQIEEREAAIKQLKNQAEQYQNSLRQTQSTKTTLQQQLNIITNRIKKLQGDINLTSNQIGATNLKIEKLSLEIEKRNNEIRSQKDNVSGILRTIYENDNQTFLEVLLANEKLSDFLGQVEYIELLEKSAQKDIEALKKLKDTLNEQKGQTKIQKNNLQTYNNQLYSQRQIENSQKVAQNELLAKTRGQEQRYQNLLDEVAQRQAQIEEEVFQIEEKLRLTLDPASVPGAHSGILSWPSGGVITQGYGYTTYSRKLYKSGFHNGLDISAGYGAPIRAAREGFIKFIGNSDKYCPRGAYGNMVVIEHDNNLTTLYGHLSAVAVTSGQAVKRGQIIGYEGSTGYSTGSHLHFGVYASDTFTLKQSNYCGLLPVGATLNPLDYL